MHLRGVARFLLIGTLAVGGMQATILTFDFTPPLAGNAPIPQGYGDNVTATVMGPFGYGAGNGFTPNITVSYHTLNADGSEKYPDTFFWPNQYASLVDFMISRSEPDDIGYGEVTFTASSGFVVLNSFQMAAFDGVNTPDHRIRILDGNDVPLWDVSPFNFTVGQVVTFTPNVGGTTLKLQFGNNWFVGIDNINFDETGQLIPEPASLLLAGLGLAGLGLLRRRRK